MTARSPTHAQEVPVIHGPDGVLTGAGRNHKIENSSVRSKFAINSTTHTTTKIEWDVAAAPSPIAPVKVLTMQGHEVVFEEEHSHIETQERDEDGVGGYKATSTG